jgi:hypothetical protein
MDKLPTEVLYYPNFDPTQLAGIKQSLLLYDKVHLIATHVLAAVNFLARIVTRRVFSHARTSSSAKREAAVDCRPQRLTEAKRH